MARTTFLLALVASAGMSIIACSNAGATVPVIAAEHQEPLLQSEDPQLERNKRTAYDFFRIAVRGARIDRVPDFVHDDYIQHNPNVETGMAGLIKYIKERTGDRPPPEIRDELIGLVNIHAEGDYVILSFALACELNGQTYSTTKFDMLRFEGEKVAEHWDSAHLRTEGAPACQRTDAGRPGR